MKVLLWLMIPMGALIVGIIWASIRARPPRPADMQDTMASFTRFRRALAAHSATNSAPRSATNSATHSPMHSPMHPRPDARDHSDVE